MKTFWKLDKQRQVKRSVQCGIWLLLIGVVVLCTAWYGNAAIARREASCTSMTSGIIYSTRYSRYNGSSVSAKYTVNGVEYYTSGTGAYDLNDRGKNITIYYNASNPSCSYTGTGMKRLSVAWWGLGVILIAGSPLMFLQAKKIHDGDWDFTNGNVSFGGNISFRKKDDEE